MILGLERRTSRKAVAIHEAGHAIASLAGFGSFIERLWIRRTPRGQGEGRVEQKALWQPFYEQVKSWGHGSRDDVVALARRDAVHLLAGPFAEIWWRNRSWWSAAMCGTENFLVAARGGDVLGEDHDFSKVIRRLRFTREPDLQPAFQQLWMDAGEVIKRHWRDVRELADWLQREGTIEAEAIYPWWEARHPTEDEETATPSKIKLVDITGST